MEDQEEKAAEAASIAAESSEGVESGTCVTRVFVAGSCKGIQLEVVLGVNLLLTKFDVLEGFATGSWEAGKGIVV